MNLVKLFLLITALFLSFTLISCSEGNKSTVDSAFGTSNGKGGQERDEDTGKTLLINLIAEQKKFITALEGLRAKEKVVTDAGDRVTEAQNQAVTDAGIKVKEALGSLKTAAQKVIEATGVTGEQKTEETAVKDIAEAGLDVFKKLEGLTRAEIKARTKQIELMEAIDAVTTAGGQATAKQNQELTDAVEATKKALIKLMEAEVALKTVELLTIEKLRDLLNLVVKEGSIKTKLNNAKVLVTTAKTVVNELDGLLETARTFITTAETGTTKTVTCEEGSTDPNCNNAVDDLRAKVEEAGNRLIKAEAKLIEVAKEHLK